MLESLLEWAEAGDRSGERRQYAFELADVIAADIELPIGELYDQIDSEWRVPIDDSH